MGELMTWCQIGPVRFIDINGLESMPQTLLFALGALDGSARPTSPEWRQVLAFNYLGTFGSDSTT